MLKWAHSYWARGHGRRCILTVAVHTLIDWLMLSREKRSENCRNVEWFFSWMKKMREKDHLGIEFWKSFCTFFLLFFLFFSRPSSTSAVKKFLPVLCRRKSGLFFLGSKTLTKTPGKSRNPTPTQRPPRPRSPPRAARRKKARPTRVWGNGTAARRRTTWWSTSNARSTSTTTSSPTPAVSCSCPSTTLTRGGRSFSSSTSPRKTSPYHTTGWCRRKCRTAPPKWPPWPWYPARRCRSIGAWCDSFGVGCAAGTGAARVDTIFRSRTHRIVPRCSAAFWTHPEIIPVGQFFRQWIKSINQSVDFHCKHLDWLIDWRKVNFDLIGLLDSYHTICFSGGGATVTEHRRTIEYFPEKILKSSMFQNGSKKVENNFKKSGIFFQIFS